MYICVDFDGTCVTHDFPKVGKDIGSQKVLKRLIENGHKLVLFTMRSNQEENYLTDAVNWFKENEIPLYGINRNPDQDEWTTSPKAWGDLYIDDAALGVPLTYDVNLSGRYFVHWGKVELILEQIGVLRK